MIKGEKMVRKTITIRDDIFESLELNSISTQYSSFSEMVSSGLKLLIEKQKNEQYKKAMMEASKDKVYLQDMEEIEASFKHVDSEKLS